VCNSETNINIVESYIKGQCIKEGNDLEKAVKFLDEITGIASYTSMDFFDNIEPSEGNLLDWKIWYKNNKNLLYWDENRQKVTVRP